MAIGSLVLLVLCTYYVEGTFPTVQEHRTYQHKSPANHAGAYNFAYDTGTGDAHSMRMEYRDESGIVRGRYGYTDPRGKLRMVEYEAGPAGFRAKGDVGPDEYLHGEAPGNVLPPPTHLQLTGWDPDVNPMVYGEKTQKVIMETPTEHHPEKGYDQPRPVAIKTPVVVERLEHGPKKEYHQPAPVALKQPVVLTRTEHHPEKGYDQPRPVAITAPVVVERLEHVPKKEYHQPAPVAIKQPVVLARSKHHPEKGYDQPRPMPIKTPVVVERLEHVPKKEYHQPAPIIVKQPVLLARTDHHPEKGYQHQRPVTVQAPPVIIERVVENVEHVPKSKYVQPAPIVQKEPVIIERVEHHPEKGYQRPIAVRAPVVVERLEHAPKKGYYQPTPVVAKQPVVLERTEHHPEKGYQRPRPIAIKAPPVVVENVVERVEHHPEKGYQRSRPLAIKAPPVIERVVESVEHIPKSKYLQPVPAALTEPAVVRRAEHHPEKGFQRPIAIKAPVVVERLVERVVKNIEHVPKNKYVQPVPVALKEPVIVERIQHHPEKGYRRPTPIAVRAPPPVVERIVESIEHVSKNKYPQPVPISIKNPTILERIEHHPEKKYQRPVALRDPIVVERLEHIPKKDYHQHASRNYRRPVPVKAPHIVERVEYHPKAEYKGGKVTYNNAPVVVSRLEHHLENGRSLPAEHRDVDIILEPAIRYTGKSKSQALQPLTVHNIDVNPNEIRRAALPSSHGHSADYHANHPPRVGTDRPPIVVTSYSVSSDDVMLHDHSAPRTVARSANQHTEHSSRQRPVRYRPWSIYSPGSFYWR